MWCTYTLEYYLPSKEGNPNIYDDTDELGGHHGQGNKPQKTHDVTYIWNRKKLIS
jgi:hypothetical protein